MKILKDNIGYFCVGLFILICTLYVCLCGENIIIPVHDNLDSTVVWFKMLRDNDLFFKLHGMIPFLGGIDRIYFVSSLKAYTLFYAIFPTFTAFVVTWFLKIILSVYGFSFLGKTIDKNYNDNKNTFILCGFLYGLAPTFPVSAFCFASLPLLLAMLIKFYKTPKNKYLLFFLFYPVLSDFSTFGLFICAYILTFIIIDSFIKHKINLQMFKPLILLAAGYVITEWNIFYLMLFSQVPSIRGTFVTEYFGILKTVKTAAEGFFLGHYHSGSMHTFVILPVCLIYTIYLFFVNFKNKTLSNLIKTPFLWLMFIILFDSLIFGLDNFYPFKKTIETLLSPLKGFGFGRTLWFNPFLWYFAFAIALCNMLKKHQYRYLLIAAAFSIFLFTTSQYNFVKYNFRNIVYQIKHKEMSKIKYSEFFAEKLFDKIKSEIDYNGELSVVYGMHPAVVEYNGIATLDGYLPYYSLDYKNKFRKLIKPEFDVDSESAKYFDDWGARAYVFSKDISYGETKDYEYESAPLLIDMSMFREMNGKYVFSRVEITNANELNLELKGVFSSEDSIYKIYVYSIKTF